MKQKRRPNDNQPQQIHERQQYPGTWYQCQVHHHMPLPTMPTLTSNMTAMKMTTKMITNDGSNNTNNASNQQSMTTINHNDNNNIDNKENGSARRENTAAMTTDNDLGPCDLRQWLPTENDADTNNGYDNNSTQPQQH